MMAALDPIEIVFDIYFLLYAIPLKRSNAHVHLDTVAHPPVAKQLLWLLHTGGFLQRLGTLLYQIAAGNISAFLIFHVVVLFHATMGYLTACSFFARSSEAKTYFNCLQNLQQRFGGTRKIFVTFSLAQR